MRRDLNSGAFPLKIQRMILWGILSLLITAGIWAQAPVRPVFEVATIRVHQNQSDPAQNDLLPGGRFTASNIPLKKLLRIALNVEDDQISGLPGWGDAASYDIEARTGSQGVIPLEEWRKLTRTLLEDRFQLKFHTVPKERTIYSLGVQKGGPKLTPHVGDGEPTMSMNGTATTNVMKATKISMTDMAALLMRATRRPVEDHTGVAGTYDIQLEWARSDVADAQGPSIYSALEEQLGLKLTTAKGQVDTVVIDRIEKPSEN